MMSQLDYFGYKLAPTQADLTPVQAGFVVLGQAKILKEMNKTD
jgi:hypothetical protein